MTNTLIGVLSAIVDNIPVMYAVLQTDPAMSTNQVRLAVAQKHYTYIDSDYIPEY